MIITYALLYMYRFKMSFGCFGSVASKKSLIKQGSTTEAQLRIESATQECVLAFAVAMHYASIWLLDCCPSAGVYW